MGLKSFHGLVGVPRDERMKKKSNVCIASSIIGCLMTHISGLVLWAPCGLVWWGNPSRGWDFKGGGSVGEGGATDCADLLGPTDRSSATNLPPMGHVRAASAEMCPSHHHPQPLLHRKHILHWRYGMPCPLGGGGVDPLGWSRLHRI